MKAAWGPLPRPALAAFVAALGLLMALEACLLYVSYAFAAAVASAIAPDAGIVLSMPLPHGPRWLGLDPVPALGVTLVAVTAMRAGWWLVMDRSLLRLQHRLHRASLDRGLRAVFELPYDAFVRENISVRTQLLMSDGERSAQASVSLLRLAVQAGSVAVTMGALLIIDWRAVAAGTVAALVLSATLVPRLRRVRRLAPEVPRLGRRRAVAANEALRAFKAVLVAGAMRRVQAEVLRRNDELNDVSQRLAGHQRAIAPTVETGLALVAVAGTMSAFLAYDQPAHALPFVFLLVVGASRLLPGVAGIYHAVHAYHVAAPSVARLRDGLADLEARRHPHESRHGRATGADIAIEARGVGFRYETGGAVLADLDLVVRRGERVGIVGPSGAGKSTLVDVLLGLLAPTSGRVSLGSRADGTRLRMAYVAQQPILLDGTVADNMALVSPDGQVDRLRAQRALERVGLASQLGEGALDAAILEGGVRLSGGQRQRLSLAVALYQQADILLLDEPTAALDAPAEAALVDLLRDLRGPTMVLVTHRPGPLAACDRVVRLADGRLEGIPEAGST